MKKLFFILLFLGFTVGLVGCSGGNSEPTPHEQIDEMLDYVERSLERAKRSDDRLSSLRDGEGSYDDYTRQILIDNSIILAGRSRTFAGEAIDEAREIAQEHGIDIMMIVRQRESQSLLELIED